MRLAAMAVAFGFAAAGCCGQAVDSGKPFFETGFVAKAGTGDRAFNAIPSLVAAPRGTLIVAWTLFGAPPNQKLRLVGARSEDGGRTWSAPFPLMDNPGKSDADPSFVVDGNRVILLSTTLPEPGKISRTEIWMTFSDDDGRTWSNPVLTVHPHVYAEGKMHVGHKLRDGRLAVGYAWDIFCEKGMAPSTEGEMDIRAGLMFSSDRGYHWTAGGDIYARPPKITPHAVNGMDEPATVVLENGEIFALLRTGTDHLWSSRSRDNGATWSEPVPAFTGHNAPAALWRLRGTNDVVVVWDHSPRNRWPLAAALSGDGCRTWSRPRVLAAGDGGQVSYPSVAQAADGTLVAVWQQDMPGRKGRDVRFARFNRAWILE